MKGSRIFEFQGPSVLMGEIDEKQPFEAEGISKAFRSKHDPAAEPSSLSPSWEYSGLHTCSLFMQEGRRLRGLRLPLQFGHHYQHIDPGHTEIFSCILCHHNHDQRKSDVPSSTSRVSNTILRPAEILTHSTRHLTTRRHMSSYTSATAAPADCYADGPGAT